MKKSFTRIISLVVALMLVLSCTAFAAYTVDEFSGVNAPVTIREGIDKDSAIGVNLVEGMTAYLIGSSASNASKYDAATDTYSEVSFAQYSNLLTFRQADGLKYELGNKYVVSFDISVSQSPENNKNISFMRYNGTGGSGRGDSASTTIYIPKGATPNVYRHVEFIYDLTNATVREDGLNDFGMWVTNGDADDGTANIANFRIEKYVANTPVANLLSKTAGANHIQSEYTVDATNVWANLIGWKDGEGVNMQAGRKYKFTAQLDIPTALNGTKQLRITRATAAWSNRSNNYSAIHQIPSGTSGTYNVEIILDFTAHTDIVKYLIDGEHQKDKDGKLINFSGLLFVAESALGQTVYVSNPKLVDITNDFALYHKIGEDILFDAPTTVYNKKYTGAAIPESVTVANTSGNDGGYNIFGWKYSDTFKLTQGKQYKISFDWSVPSSTDETEKAIVWSLSEATVDSTSGWTGRGDYLANGGSLKALVDKDTLSGTASQVFTYSPKDINSGIVLWRSDSKSAAAEYTISNVKIVPVPVEIDIQTDGDEIVVIQNKDNANTFNDVIILAEYEGEDIKNISYTLPSAIAEMNEEGTIALRAKLSGVGENSTVKMYRWNNLNEIKPIAEEVNVKN